MWFFSIRFIVLLSRQLKCSQNVVSYSFEFLHLPYHRSVAKMLSVFFMRRLYLNYVSGQVKLKSLKCWKTILKHILVHYGCSGFSAVGFKAMFQAATPPFWAWALHIEKKLVSVEVCLWAYFLINESFVDSLNGANFHNCLCWISDMHVPLIY